MLGFHPISVHAISSISTVAAAPANLVAGPMQNLMGGFTVNYGGQGFIDPGIQKTESGT